MSEPLHPGLHPDADSLNAFIEGGLPDHERRQCLAHLAECPRCREVVFLAQEPQPVSAASQPIPAWRRWLTPVPVLATAAGVCVAVLAAWLYVRHTGGAPSHNLVAAVSPAPPRPAPGPNVTREPQRPRPAARRPVPKEVVRTRPVPGSTRNSSPPNLPVPPAVSTPPGTTLSALAPVVPALPPNPPAVEAKEERAAAGITGIAGTVTDPSGAVIPGATVKVRQLDGTTTADARTDGTGQFHLTELPAGRYELQIGAPGFRQALRQVDLQPREVASVKSQLELGSAAETVEVAAGTPVIQTETSSVRGKPSRKIALPEEPRPLPSKLPPVMTATRGKLLVALDSEGTVFVSRNSGRSWKAVKPIWSGKVRSLALAELSAIPPATFRLTTDSGTAWLSRDGARWYPAPPQP